MELLRGFPKPWLALPHSSTLINYLKLKYGVMVIPRLVVVKDDGFLITDKGVRDVRKRSKRCFTDWYNVAKEVAASSHESVVSDNVGQK